MPQSLFLSQIEGLADDLIKSRQFGLSQKKEEREARLQEVLRAIQAERLGIEQEKHDLEVFKTRREIQTEEERRGLFPEPPSAPDVFGRAETEPTVQQPVSQEGRRVLRGARAKAFTPGATDRILALGPEGYIEGERAGLLKSRVEASRGLSDLEAIEGARASKKDRVDYLRLKFGDSLADAYATNSDKFSDSTEIMLSNVFPEELRLIALIKGGLLMAAKEKDPAERFNLLAKVDENIMNAMKSLEALKDPKDRAFMMERINASVSLRDQVAGMAGVEGGPGSTLRPGAPPIFFGKPGTEIAPPSMRFGPPPSGPSAAPPPPSSDDHNQVIAELLRTPDPTRRFAEIENELSARGFDVASIAQRLGSRMKHKEPARALSEFFQRAPGEMDIFGGP